MSSSDDIIRIGSLEMILKDGIKDIPNIVKMYRDFLFGWVLGQIQERCLIFSRMFLKRELEPNEYKELWDTIRNKLPQINARIHEQG